MGKVVALLSYVINYIWQIIYMVQESRNVHSVTLQ